VDDNSDAMFLYYIIGAVVGVVILIVVVAIVVYCVCCRQSRDGRPGQSGWTVWGQPKLSEQFIELNSANEWSDGSKKRNGNRRGLTTLEGEDNHSTRVLYQPPVRPF